MFFSLSILLFCCLFTVVVIVFLKALKGEVLQISFSMHWMAVVPVVSMFILSVPIQTKH